MNKDEIKVGERYRHTGPDSGCGGSVDLVLSIEGAFLRAEEVVPGSQPRPGVHVWGVGTFADWHEPEQAAEPAPAPSQHPQDLKPRTGKAPLHLIPWAVVPRSLTPAPFLALVDLTLPDGDSFEIAPEAPPDSTPARLFRTLIAEGTTLAQVAEVFAHGARKYARDNWRTFTWDKDAEDCYFGAIMRHLVADHGGETLDPESGLPHRAHAACGCLIWLWHVSDAPGGGQ